MTPKTLMITGLLLALSAVTGWVAHIVGLPLPYLLGPLILNGLIATFGLHHLPDDYEFPPRLRLVFIAIIGLMIGTQVTPDLFTNWQKMLPSLAALTLFVILAFAMNFVIFQRIGGYDRATAFYSSTAGGLFESIAMGEEAGADIRRLMLQQFLRIIMVVTILPIGLSFWMGGPVGSAAGMTLARDTGHWQTLPISLVAAMVGLGLGRALKLPAGQLMGPMMAAALLTLTGWADLAIPQWLVNLAQIVVGTTLGLRFAGIDRGMILRGMGLSMLSVLAMLTLGALMAYGLRPLTGQPFDVLLISFAPGGVTEMSLVALSLDANPAFVALHHIYRILMTVVLLIVTARALRRFL